MRRIISVWLCAMMMSGAFIGMTFGNDVGGGNTNPGPRASYTITNVWELQNMSLDLNGNYTLANDIDASITSGWNGGAGFVPVGPFSGHLDGCNHTISGLYIYRAGTNYQGLFGGIGTEGTVKNIGLVDIDVLGYDWVGGLAGYNVGLVSNCYATGTVSGDWYIGGLAGVTDTGATIENCHFTGTVSGSEYVGGITGFCWSTVSNSYVTGTVNGAQYVGGLLGNTGAPSNACYSYATCDVNGWYYVGGLVGMNYGLVTNCYATGIVTETHNNCGYIGGLAGWIQGTIIDSYSTGLVYTGGVTGTTDVGGLIGYSNAGTITGSFWDTQTSGQATSAGGTGKTTAEMKTQSTFTGAGWDFTTIWHMLEGFTYPVFMWKPLPFGGGDGTLGNPYLIRDVWDLQLMNNKLTAHYALANDIDASLTATWNSGAGFAPVGKSATPFSGSLDGNNYTVSGLYINRPGTVEVGLFGYANLFTALSNVSLADVDITGDQYVGGLVGYSVGAVSYCNIAGTVNGRIYVGGLVGYKQSSTTFVSRCHASVTVTTTQGESGGLVGYNLGTVSNSSASGNVYRIGSEGCWDIGGLVGRNNGVITTSYATASVSGPNDIGGLTGCNYGSVMNSYATGPASGTASYAGGLVGYNAGPVSKSYSVGNVAGSSFVGGLIGQNTNTVSDSFWDLQTSGQATSAGGTGKTTAEMMDLDTFVGATWDLLHIWDIDNEQSYPYFRTTSPYIIYDVFDLQIMGLDLTGHYTVANDIDASITSGWNGGMGFDPIADSSNYFAGTFNGQNHTITGLYINREFEDCVGPIAYMQTGALVTNVRLEDVNVTGNTFVGGFIGRCYGSTVSNCYVTGVVRGRGACVGGFVGETSATVSSCFTDCIVYAIPSGNNYYLGGFAGDIYGLVSNCYATSDVSASGAGYVGGFAGAHFSNTIQYCYSTGDVPDTGSNIGGFVGTYSGGTYTACFWDTDTSGTTIGIGSGSSSEVQGKTTAEMMAQSTFTGWDFTNIWHVAEGITYPLFRWQDLPLSTLMAYWPFDEGSGQYANDTSGNNNTGTLMPGYPGNAPAWTSEGISGNALVFDGADDYVTAPNSTSLCIEDEITLSVWLKTSTVTPAWAALLAKHYSNTLGSYVLYYAGSEPWLLINTEAGKGEVHGAGHSINDGKWHNIVGTYDGANVSLYDNGALIASTPWTGKIKITPYDIIIGKRTDGSQCFNGVMDEISILNRALSSSEISEQYHKYMPVCSIDLQAGWNLVSVPVLMDNTSLSSVLSSISGKYDCAKYFDSLDVADPWKTYRPSGPANDLASIDRTMGFWLYATEACTLNVTGTVPSSTAIGLHAGWNLVGYPTQTERAISDALAGTGYDMVEGFMAAAPYVQPLSDSYVMRPGEGYWVHVPADTVWTVDW